MPERGLDGSDHGLKTCEIVFRPSAVAVTEIGGGVVEVGVDDRSPECKTAVDGWLISDKLFFTDGRQIMLGYYRKPSTGILLEMGHIPFWETVDGRIFGKESIKGWVETKFVKITISR